MSAIFNVNNILIVNKRINSPDLYQGYDIVFVVQIKEDGTSYRPVLNSRAVSSAEINFGDGTGIFRISTTSTESRYSHIYEKAGDYVVTFKESQSRYATKISLTNDNGIAESASPYHIRKIIKIEKDTIPWQFLCKSALDEQFIIPSNITSIQSQAFFNSIWKNEPLVIPSSVKTIGWWAFRGTSNLSCVIFEGTPTSIDDEAFYGFSGEMYVPWHEGEFPACPFKASSKCVVHYDFKRNLI